MARSGRADELKSSPIGHLARPGAPLRWWLLLAAAAVISCSAPRKPAPLTLHSAPQAQDERARDAWQLPDVVVEKLRIAPGMRVADIGSGAGYLLPMLSRAVGPEGKVFAVEVQPQLVERLRRRVVAEKLSNVVVVQSSEVDAPLPESVDRLILLHSYRELAQPIELLRALKQRLQPTGRLFIGEFLPPPDPAGMPLPLPADDARVAPETIEAEARGAGLIATQRFAVLPHQYFAMFVNAEEVTAAPPPPAEGSESTAPNPEVQR